MPTRNKANCFFVGLLLTTTGFQRDAGFGLMARSQAVRPLFDLSSPERSPFPSDRFTVADAAQNTGRRVNLPMPDDCIANASECEDIAVLNQLDGFNLQARISVPFDGEIDPASVTSSTVFLVQLGDAVSPGDVRRLARAAKPTVVGINHIVWDPATRELSFRPDDFLEEHTRYALIVTTGVRDSNGNPIGVTEGFRYYRRDLAHDADPYYRRTLLAAESAVRRAFDQQRAVDIAALSVFTTQSFSHIIERVREAIQAVPAPTLNFGVGPECARAVFDMAQIQTLTNSAQFGVSGPLTPQSFPVLLAAMRVIPGAVGTVAFGTFLTPDFTTRATGHIAPIPTRTGTLTPTGSFDVAFSLTLPAGAPPAGGWPIAICLHGSGVMRFACLQAAAVLNSHAVALLVFNLAGHGGGPRTTTTVGLTGTTSMTFAAPGNGYDRNGDGMIDTWEPQVAAPPYRLQGNTPTSIQSTAMLLHLVRGLQAGVDVNGDGVSDLDGSRIYLFGHSDGNVPGMMGTAVEPAIRSSAFIGAPGTLIYNTPLSPPIRPGLGRTLSERTPSLLNNAYGVTSIDGQGVDGPHFNENLPLRNQRPLVNTIPGAVTIQRYMDHRAWAEQAGDTVGFATMLRRAPRAGVPARPFLFLMARSDPSSVNPGTTSVIRAGEFADRVLYYRHDLNFGLTDVPATPHVFFFPVTAAPNYSRIAFSAQHQIGTFFASDGAHVRHPTPVELWELPIGSPLPEDLLFLPRPR